jgi:DNA-binding NtrC family response regulator
MVNPEDSVSPSHEGSMNARPDDSMAVEGEPLSSLQDMEQRYIARVLQVARGNQRQAARILGISRWSLARRLRKYGLPPRTAA